MPMVVIESRYKMIWYSGSSLHGVIPGIHPDSQYSTESSISDRRTSHDSKEEEDVA